MTNPMLAALSQPALPLEAPSGNSSPVRARARRARLGAATYAGAAAERRARQRSRRAYDVREFSRRLAARFDGLEALEVGVDVDAAPGLAQGDMVLVDRISQTQAQATSAVARAHAVSDAGPSAGEAEPLLAVVLRAGRACVTTSSGDADATLGTVFAVIRRDR